MRLIQCKIENFGKLSNLTLDFSSGLNSFIKENGWGKSTLAAFVKVMFFGFEGERTRDDVANERRRYNPWQGGVYGGSLTFETEGKGYTMTRIFGAKEKDDTFELRETDTNLPSADYSERIGEELFQIDGASFARTVYISQNNCKTETTDSINAKLGNLAEHTDDINNFETVIGRFQDMMNKMSSRRKTGSLAIRKNQIAEMEQDIQRGTAIEQSIRDLVAKKEEEKARYGALKERQKQLEEKQKEVQVKKDLQAKQEKYQMLRENLKTCEEELSREQMHFPGELPKEEDLRTYGQMSQSLLQLQQSVEHYRLLPEEERQLAIPTPKEEEIDRCWDIYPQVQELDKQIVAKSAALQAAKAAVPVRKNNAWIMPVLGIVLAVIGVVLIFVNFFSAGVPAIVVGLALLVWGLVGKKNKVDNSAFDEQEQLLQKVQQERDALYQEISDRLAPYVGGGAVAESRLLITLQEFRRVAQIGRVLQEKAAKQEQAQREYQEAQERIFAYLQTLSIAPAGDLVSQFAALREHLNTLEKARRICNDARVAKNNFEETNDVIGLSRMELQGGDDSLTEIGEEMRHIAKELEEKHQNLLSYERQLEEKREIRDAISEKEEELERLRELQVQEQKKLELIEKSKELMEQAKTSFTQKYMAPIMNGFVKYYGLMTGETAKEYHLDANTRLTVEQQGMQRETKFLSTGYQDLIGVCMRLALVDAMYQGEKPFIIMDDPFVNLDEEKAKGGRALLAEVAKEYQVIWFSCRKF